MSIRKKGMRLLSILLSACMIQNMTLPAFASQQIVTTETEVEIQVGENAETDTDVEVASATNAAVKSVVYCNVRDEIELSPDEDLLEDLPENDELLTGYFEQELYDIPSGGISMFGTLGSSMLKKDVSKNIYSILKSNVQNIAAGKQASSEITITQSKLGVSDQSWTKEELGDITLISGNQITEEAKTAAGKKLQEVLLSEKDNIINYLLVDCPYELYWYDKTETGNSSMGCTYGISSTGEEVTISNIKLYISLGVSKDYASSGTTGTYLVDTNKTKNVTDAAAKAKAIVDKHSSENDYNKLKSYLEEICDLVSYDEKTLNNPPAYGNPWQVIYVFDGDDSTNVVCEGYAKAFQYLCDLTEFENNGIVCYTVNGTMSGGTGAGPHMWNIVTMDNGKNYLVDVTNCDTGSIGEPDKLFLMGTNGSVSTGYTFNVSNTNISYTYSSDQSTMYGTGILTLADSQYVEAFGITGKPDSVIYGDSFTLSTKGSEATDTITWTTSNENVAAVNNGTVKTNGTGTVTITAQKGTETDSYTFEVSKKVLTAVGTVVTDKYYDGTDSATVSSFGNLVGIVGSDNVEIANASAYFANGNPGTNRVAYVMYTLGGTESGKYDLETATVTAEIKQAPITVKNVLISSKTYDGTTSGNVTSVVFEGLVNNESLTLGKDYTVKAAYGSANAGENIPVTITVTMKNTDLANHYSLAEAAFSTAATIAKAPLTVKADNVSMKTGAGKPSFTATVTGLVGTETMTGIQFADNAADTTKTGKYVITPSGGTISSGNLNYNITYTTGTLTIVLDSAKMDAALESAENAKKGISVSDTAASTVSKGTKFVTTEEMKALETAIANAETILENATTMAEINNATAELEQAIATFQSAIKVGTKTSSTSGGGGGGSSSGGGGSSSSGTKTSTAWFVTIDTATNTSGAWVQDATGWWFRYSNGTWPAAKWVELSKSGVKTWYSFNAAGYMETGWKLDGNYWYYLNPTTGAMVTGWVQVNGVWYYLNPVSGTKPLGAMYCNEMTPDGYFVDASGAWR